MKQPKVMMIMMLGGLFYTNASAQSQAASHKPTFINVKTISLDANDDGYRETAKGTGTPLGTNLIPMSNRRFTGHLITTKSGLASLKHERVWNNVARSGVHYMLLGNNSFNAQAPRSATANPASGLAAGTGTYTGTNFAPSANPEYYKKGIPPRAGTHSGVSGANKWNR